MRRELFIVKLLLVEDGGLPRRAFHVHSVTTGEQILFRNADDFLRFLDSRGSASAQPMPDDSTDSG